MLLSAQDTVKVMVRVLWSRCCEICTRQIFWNWLLLNYSVHPMSFWFIFVLCPYKQNQTINHHILHYFVEVYCVRNLKHLFKNWISDPFFFPYTNVFRILMPCNSLNWTKFMKAAQWGVSSLWECRGSLFRFLRGVGWEGDTHLRPLFFYTARRMLVF